MAFRTGCASSEVQRPIACPWELTAQKMCQLVAQGTGVCDTEEVRETVVSQGLIRLCACVEARSREARSCPPR